ncbi:unnamed protein product [Linum trigynum]|uniref:Uncharacterized protein n=1 Tax=Linum trigynum TaxID=586398 RepID=A0AAV2CWP7_9ROSI
MPTDTSDWWIVTDSEGPREDASNDPRHMGLITSEPASERVCKFLCRVRPGGEVEQAFWKNPGVTFLHPTNFRVR